MDMKTDTVLHWQAPSMVCDVQRFLSFANFYQHFIRNFAQKVALLTALMRKCVPF